MRRLTDHLVQDLGGGPRPWNRAAKAISMRTFWQ